MVFNFYAGLLMQRSLEVDTGCCSMCPLTPTDIYI